MLIPGIKIGPKNWQPQLNCQPSFVEVWFRIDWADRYQEPLQKMLDNQIPFGLHFWGITSSGHEANLAYPGEIQTESLELMTRCIEYAHEYHARYVNIHAGNNHLMHLNLDQGFSMFPDDSMPAIPPDQSAQTRNGAVSQLGKIAHLQNVELLVELIPQATYNEPKGRLSPVPEYPAPIDGLLELCQQDIIGFTNDFCHTYCFDPQNFQQITTDFLPYTKLCHINTLYDPHNGTDAHGGILPENFDRHGVFPNQSQYLDLFKRLNDQPHDIWLVGEPKTQHVENYHQLANLLSQIS
jgi:hypothetical protein